MDTSRKFIVVSAVITMMTLAVSGDVPIIDPKYSVFYVLEGQPLTMTCTGLNTNSLQWYIGARTAVDQGFTSSSKIDVLNGVSTMMVTIHKSVASPAETATYTCQVGASQSRTIRVVVLSNSVTNAEYKEEEESATLACSLVLDPSKYNLHWEFNDKKLQDGVSYTIDTESNTLFINNTAPVDRGDYFCVFSFPENNQTITIPVSFKLAEGTEVAPTVDPDYSPLYAVLGMPLNLTCSSEGTDYVHWYRGNRKIIDANLGFTGFGHIDSSSGKTIANIFTFRANQSDDGAFLCLTGIGERSVTVEILTVDRTNVMFNDKQDSVTLVCRLMNIDHSKYNETWELKKNTLKNSSKYTTVKDNNTLSLVINEPGIVDQGEYYCTYNFTDNMQVVRVPVSLTMIKTGSVSLAGTVMTVWPLHILPTILSVLHFFN